MGEKTDVNWNDQRLQSRFWSKVKKDGPIPEHRPDLGPCWLWTGATTTKGYPIFVVATYGRHTTAHRVSYAIKYGREPLEQGDHVCRNRLCVNPDHIEDVSNKENTQRGARGRLVTTCVNGHQYTDENTIIRKNGRRFCRTCRKAHDKKRGRDAAYWREYRAKRKKTN